MDDAHPVPDAEPAAPPAPPVATEPGQAPTAPPTAEPMWPSGPAAPASGPPQAPFSAPPFGGSPGQDLVVADNELPPANLWQKMKADPAYAPEHLALEAVKRLGPQARNWVQRTHAQYPGIDNHTVAQIAARKFTS